ncbi:hypothetical protein L207DRAFT_261625 [Hyaloscypha variabilis F]|uniref:Uncharacterized protein n=1 Tax=Hyaloscypha variabilis (strain UAMH 11265 / GT02V1 / F) TaxID=1149755 RepID=A0A2J6QSM7_HYAVF|nr:hypothetical protein L207DRAFT_261625 [Hyaloscypha variabilis F]
MLTSKHEAPPPPCRVSWPLKFFESRRYFSRNAENQPYIEWLKDYLLGGDEWSESEDEDEEEEEEESDNFESSCADEYDAPKWTCEDLNEVKVIKNHDRRSFVRVFMEGVPGDEKFLPYRDQTDVVAGFCETQVSREGDAERPGPSEKLVALLDDRKSGEIVQRGKARRIHYRECLTARELKTKLSRKVARVPICLVLPYN